MELGEALGTVAALKQEALARRDRRKVGGQSPRLAGEHERRKARDLLLRGSERLRIGIVGQLARLKAAPAPGGPADSHYVTPCRVTSMIDTCAKGNA